MNVDYKMTPPKTAKDEIKHPKLAVEGVIPKLGSSILVVGKSGSGKSCLCHNLLKDPKFYGGAFDKIFIVSATGDTDDILDGLHVPENHIFSDLEEGSKAIDMLQKHQSEMIAKKGNGKAPQIGLVLDDCIGDNNFLQSAPFLRSFIASRHFNKTTFLCSQHLRKVPKICRLQAGMIVLFPSSQSETDTICDEYCPPGLNKKQFQAMLEDAWEQPYQFMSIHMKQPMATRYRKGLAQVYNLEEYKDKKKRNVRDAFGEVSGEPRQSKLSAFGRSSTSNWAGSFERQAEES
jgi:hypothetical protein